MKADSKRNACSVQRNDLCWDDGASYINHSRYGALGYDPDLIKNFVLFRAFVHITLIF